MSKHKVRLYKAHNHKEVTGVIITSDHKLRVKNKQRLKTINALKDYKMDKNDEKKKQRLQGLVVSCRQIEAELFPAITETLQQ